MLPECITHPNMTQAPKFEPLVYRLRFSKPCHNLHNELFIPGWLSAEAKTILLSARSGMLANFHPPMMSATHRLCFIALLCRNGWNGEPDNFKCFFFFGGLLNQEEFCSFVLGRMSFCCAKLRPPDGRRRRWYISDNGGLWHYVCVWLSECFMTLDCGLYWYVISYRLTT